MLAYVTYVRDVDGMIQGIQLLGVLMGRAQAHTNLVMLARFLPYLAAICPIMLNLISCTASIWDMGLTWRLAQWYCSAC